MENIYLRAMVFRARSLMVGEWTKVRSVEINLGAAAAKFDAGLVTMVMLQQQQSGTVGNWNGDVVKGIVHSRGRNDNL
jgi:hypothetical protein